MVQPYEALTASCAGLRSGEAMLADQSAAQETFQTFDSVSSDVTRSVVHVYMYIIYMYYTFSFTIHSCLPPFNSLTLASLLPPSPTHSLPFSLPPSLPLSLSPSLPPSFHPSPTHSPTHSSFTYSLLPSLLTHSLTVYCTTCMYILIYMYMYSTGQFLGNAIVRQ